MVQRVGRTGREDENGASAGASAYDVSVDFGST
jgi:hypothetical protein